MVKTIVVSLEKSMAETQTRSLEPNQFEFVGGKAATGTVAVLDGTMNYITITNGGNGYTSPPQVVISGGGGSLASGSAMIANGSVVAVVLGNLGENYVSEPTLSLLGGRSIFTNKMIEKGD